MDKINILYCFDSKSWHMAAVSMESLLLNANPATHITIYCMVAPGTRGRRKIKKIIGMHKYINADLVWREIKPEENPFQKDEYSKWNPVTFYRLIAYRFFKDVDKFLYLSNDTLVFHDLFELYNTDISNEAFAAVYDMAPINDSTNANGLYVKDFSAKYLNGGPYYNSGVLLLNLKKFAENERVLFDVKVPLRYPEQDLLNAAFVGKIKTLPIKYNLAPGVGVPSHFSAEETAEVSAGKHVILDCYYTKAYDKEHSNKIAYEMFAKCAKIIGVKTESFMKANRKKMPIKKTFIPHITIREGKIYFFGMKIG